MYKKKNAQNSVELMIILIFVLVIMGIVMYVAGEYFVEINDNKEEIQAESFAKNINKEIEILGKVEDGYHRELYISDDTYKVEISHSRLVLREKITNESYYFDLIGDYNISLINKTISGQNKTYLVLDKPKTDFDDYGLGE
jgi:uncharacterized protein (UPF0333 family)